MKLGKKKLSNSSNKKSFIKVYIKKNKIIPKWYTVIKKTIRGHKFLDRFFASNIRKLLESHKECEKGYVVFVKQNKE